MTKPLLAYWDIRGLAEPCRLMLNFAGCDFEDKRYKDGSIWFDNKEKLGLDFPNLPYYFNGDVKLTESWAIMKHIARTFKTLLPTTDVEKDNCDMMQGVVSDFKTSFAMVCYKPEFDTNKAAFFKDTFPNKMESFDRYLSEKTWLSGDNLTYVDFVFAELCDIIRLMEPDCLKKYENVSKYVENFFQLEKVAAYRESSSFKKFPINGSMAKWGGKAE